jgi:acetate kinase
LGGNQRASLAIDIFIYRIRKYIVLTCPCWGWTLDFYRGIGENKADIRERVSNGFVQVFQEEAQVLVIPTNEELMIARQAYKLIVPADAG